MNEQEADVAATVFRSRANWERRVADRDPELVTNAIRYSDSGSGWPDGPWFEGAARISLTLRLLPGRLMVEVFDGSHHLPVLSDAEDEAESGRGLMLVQALSKEWGHFCLPSGGKTVFCVLDIPDSAVERSRPFTTAPAADEPL